MRNRFPAKVAMDNVDRLLSSRLYKLQQEQARITAEIALLERIISETFEYCVTGERVLNENDVIRNHREAQPWER